MSKQPKIDFDLDEEETSNEITKLKETRYEILSPGEYRITFGKKNKSISIREEDIPVVLDYNWLKKNGIPKRT